MRRRRRRRRICLGEISGHDEDEDARRRTRLGGILSFMIT